MRRNLLVQHEKMGADHDRNAAQYEEVPAIERAQRREAECDRQHAAPCQEWNGTDRSIGQGGQCDDDKKKQCRHFVGRRGDRPARRLIPGAGAGPRLPGMIMLPQSARSPRRGMISIHCVLFRPARGS